jgi:hypothetical protein
MKTKSDDQTVSAGLSAMLSRVGARKSVEKPASGIAVVELDAEQLDRVSGGMMALAARAGTTCCPCCDDCGSAA